MEDEDSYGYALYRIGEATNSMYMSAGHRDMMEDPQGHEEYLVAPIPAPEVVEVAVKQALGTAEEDGAAKFLRALLYISNLSSRHAILAQSIATHVISPGQTNGGYSSISWPMSFPARTLRRSRPSRDRSAGCAEQDTQQGRPTNAYSLMQRHRQRIMATRPTSYSLHNGEAPTSRRSCFPMKSHFGESTTGTSEKLTHR